MRSIFMLCAVLALGACVSQVREVVPQTITEPAGSAALSLDMINAERSAAGLSPLRRDAALERAALAHAKDMAARGYFDHVSPEGQTPRGRLLASGDCGLLTGENIAKGQRTTEEVVRDWMASEGHRRNNLNGSFVRGGFVQYGDIYVLTFSGAC